MGVPQREDQQHGDDDGPGDQRASSEAVLGIRVRWLGPFPLGLAPRLDLGPQALRRPFLAFRGGEVGRHGPQLGDTGTALGAAGEVTTELGRVAVTEAAEHVAEGQPLKFLAHL